MLYGGLKSTANSYSFCARSRTFVLPRAERQITKFSLSPQMKLHGCRFEVKTLTRGLPIEKPLCLITEQFGHSSTANRYRYKRSAMQCEIRHLKSPQLTFADEEPSCIRLGSGKSMYDREESQLDFQGLWDEVLRVLPCHCWTKVICRWSWSFKHQKNFMAALGA